MRKPSGDARERALRSLGTISDEEDAALGKAIAEDPDAAPELTEEWFARARRGGRPRSESPKEPVSLRIDPEVLAYFRAGGPGWQTRINEALRLAAGLPATSDC